MRMTRDTRTVCNSQMVHMRDFILQRCTRQEEIGLAKSVRLSLNRAMCQSRHIFTPSYFIELQIIEVTGVSGKL